MDTRRGNSSKIRYSSVPFVDKEVPKHLQNDPSGVRVSNFSITLSTNQRIPEGLKHEWVLMLQDALTVFEDDGAVSDMIKYKINHRNSDEYFTDDDAEYDTRVVAITATSVAEVGNTKHGGRLHAHVNLKIWHGGHISLKPDVVKAALNGRLEDAPFKIHYVHITAKGIEGDDYLHVLEMQQEYDRLNGIRRDLGWLRQWQESRSGNT